MLGVSRKVVHRQPPVVTQSLACRRPLESSSVVLRATPQSPEAGKTLDLDTHK